ncbi:MAG: hypothetical protein HYZ45_06015, partial [Burkholderiales bacterium]|nr:hypothetical protein [Burkholderiales bacterium]
MSPIVGAQDEASAQAAASISSATASRNAAWAEPIAAEQNLFRVTPSFFRSARLLPQDVTLLQKLGIKTVVSLRAFHSDESVLKNTAIKMIRVPI